MYYALPNIQAPNPVLLWGVRGPHYSARPLDIGGRAATITATKTESDQLRSMARGARPVGQKLKGLESQATIMGGIQTLKDAGVYPWTLINTSGFPALYFTKKKSRESVHKLLKGLVQLAASKTDRGLRIPSASFGAEYVRKKVSDAGLQAPAWAARGVILTQEALTNQATREKVEKTTGSALSTAATAVQVIPVVGQIIGGILGGLSTAAGVSAARTKVEASRSEQQLAEFQQMYRNSLSTAISQARYSRAKGEFDAVQAKVRSEREKKEREAEELGKKVAKAAEVTIWVTLSGATAITAVWIYRRWQKGSSR